MKTIFLISIFITSSVIQAFDYEKCENGLSKRRTGLGGGVLSTSSFISSTGECSMIGSSDHDKKVFIAHNKNQIKNDIARGEGDYLAAYLKLSNYSDVPFVGNKLKSNFSYIFGKNGEASAQQAYERIENILNNKKKRRDSRPFSELAS
ncbi:MAG: DUF3015 domain-containing protein [Oligoflexia bacterium]|nr:DUF3015 domain-containing protein [Oligoflexia bacterium]